MHSLADTLIVNYRDLSKLRVNLSVAHACAERYCISCLADKCLLMSVENSLSSESELAVACSDLDGLHRRRGSLGKSSQRVFGHMRTLLDLHSALCNFHSESHTRRTSTFLTVFLWC